MHVFIDASGSFTGFHKGSISVVGALAIPDAKLDFLTKKFAKIRARLPIEKGEVKGRLLTEEQVDEGVALLARNEVLFEVSAIDLGIQDEAGARDYKQKHGEDTLAKVPNFREDVRSEVEAAGQEILTTSLQLYLQALTTFEVLHRLIGHTTLFYAQRRAFELGSFTWIVDGKEKATVTKCEKWWSHYAQGALATMSKRRPMPHFEGEGYTFDYSFYRRSFGTVDDKGETGTDLGKLLKDIHFSAKPEAGLEFVDILTNAIRRAQMGNLQMVGWKNIQRLMVHRKERYIQFIFFGDGPDVVRRAPYGKVVNDGFSSGGKSMMTPSNQLLLDKETAQDGSNCAL